MTAEPNTALRPPDSGSEPDASCAWCGARLVPGAASGTVPCATCGARTTWPVPTDEELDRAYGAWYRPERGRFSGLGDRLLRRTRGRTARRLDRIAPDGPILDVGAGDGALLDALSAVGREAVGLERHSERADVREEDIADVQGRWAGIVFWHSLEHLREPGAAVQRAAGLLEPGGVMVIAMPNPASIQARVFGDRWLALDLPRHLVHVPAATLLARLRALGLRPSRVSYLRGGQVVFGWLHGIVGTLPSHPDLYDAIRRPEARREAISPGRRLLTLGAAVLALPLAAACAGVEVLLRRGGTTYVEARRG
ncbi:MAG TPA: class I SAM-dependent methyltransferase [Solirubrobacterales bacterium]|nr:class I SAM-dependent methyltransferase [Solirubrobacterales bacterium]